MIRGLCLAIMEFLCEQMLFKKKADVNFADFSILWLNGNEEKPDICSVFFQTIKSICQNKMERQYREM